MSSEHSEPHRNSLAAAVKALQEREARLAAILEAATDAIITIDEHGEIESVNAATTQMFGYEAKELLGQNVAILMPSPYREEHDRYISNYFATGEKHIIGIGREVVAQRKDGSLFPVDLAVSEVDHLRIFTGVLRDISERKRLESEIVEIISLEQQRLGADLHDACGQELTALGLLVNSLTEQLRVSSPGEVELATRIGDAIRGILQYVRNLAHGLTQPTVDPRDLLSALEQLADRVDTISNLACTFESDGTVEISNAKASTHLYRIAQEACTNALRHSSARNISIFLGTRAGTAILEVKDDGNGFSTDVTEGTGFQLMRNRAHEVGAELDIMILQPHGTAVTCRLP